MMFGFQVKNRQNAAASPSEPASPSTPAVGEIDTKAPFESVKAAVNLFVEASPKADRPVLKKSRTMEESVLGKETQLHWIFREIDKYKEHVKTAESMKGKALEELKRATKSLEELTNKLEAASESKQLSIEATEAANARAEQLESTKNQEAVDNERNQYKAVANQLISAKQQLNNLKQDFDIALEAKLASFQQAAEAQHAAKLNRKKINELCKDVGAMSQTLECLKLASAKAEQDHAKIMEEKEALLNSKKNEKEDIDLKIQGLIMERAEHPAGNINLKKRLEETSEAVNVLRDQLKEVRAADMELLRNANVELEEAKRRLDEMKEEEMSVRDVVESLKQELENVRKDISAAEKDDLKREQLQAELNQIKLEVEEAITKKTIATNEVNELESKIVEMSLEFEKATQQEEQMKRQVETHWREAQRAELAIKESEAKLEIARREVEEAKTAKELADDQIHKQPKDPKIIDSNSNNTIMLTTQDFEALSRKAEEATTAADTKVATIMGEVETIRQKEREILEKLEKSVQENKEIQEEISKAQKTAEVANSARQTLESELNKWRQETKA